MKLTDFFFADQHESGSKMPIPLPSGKDSGEWLRVVGVACDRGVAAGRDYARAYQAARDELASLDAECKAKNDWTRYNSEMNWKTDALNDALALEIVTGWSFDNAFSREALHELLKQYKGLSTLVAQHFEKSRVDLQKK